MLSCITERLERIYNLSITPKVAVFLATYNGEKFLNQQIDSILSQKNVEVDIYCNDDGSSDGTLEIIKSYQISKKNVCTHERACDIHTQRERETGREIGAHTVFTQAGQTLEE